MTRPFRENLEIVEEADKKWVRCMRCGHRLSSVNEDWRQACVTKRLPPSQMGPHRELLEGRVMLEERYCPNCGVTMDASVVEVETATDAPVMVRPARREGKIPVIAQPVTLDPATTAIIVLDLNIRAENPENAACAVIRPAKDFLARSRGFSVPIIFTVVVWEKETPDGDVAPLLNRGADEPLLYPNGYNKFVGGDLLNLLHRWGTKTLVLLGGGANFALLYTASAASREHGYSVVIPLDGIYAQSDYEMDYALYQFTVLPRVQDKFRFTNLAEINFN